MKKFKDKKVISNKFKEFLPYVEAPKDDKLQLGVPKDKWDNIICVSGPNTGEIPLVLENSWVDYGSTFSVTPASYRREGNTVYLNGLIKNGTSGIAIIATLPLAFRPINTQLTNATTSANVFCRIDVRNDGVIIATAPASTGWLSLANISFVID